RGRDADRHRGRGGRPAGSRSGDGRGGRRRPGRLTAHRHDRASRIRCRSRECISLDPRRVGSTRARGGPMSERQEQSRTSFPEHTRGWIDGPIFATDRRGGRITTLAPGGSTGTLSAGDALRALGVMLFWAVFLFFAPMNLTMPAPVPWVAETRTQWWWYAILILGIVLLLTVGAFGLHSGIIERFGQRSLAMLIVALPVSVGALIAMSLHLLLFRAALDAWPTDGFDPDKPDPTVPLLFTYAAAAAV